MGASGSRNKYETTKELIRLAKGGPHCSSGSITGSSEVFFGKIADVFGGISQSAKEELIKMFYEMARKDLNIGKDKPEASNIDDMVQFLMTAVPTLRTHKDVKNGKEVFNNAMKRMAAAINKYSGETLIDERADPIGVFYDVVKFMKNVMAGFTQEYKDIADALGEIAENVDIIEELLRRQFMNIIEKCATDSDSAVLTQVKDQFDMMMKKLKLQGENLKNLSNKAEEKVPLDERIKKVEMLTGMKAPEGNGTSLLSALTGVVESSALTRKLDKALKEIGMSVQDYKNASYDEFKHKIRDLFVNRLGVRENDEALLKFLRSVNDLKNYFPNRKEILGSCDECEKEVVGRAELPKSLKQKKKLRDEILVAFVEQLSEIVHHALAITDQIGTDIKSKNVVYSDSFQELVNGITLLEKLGDTKQMYYVSGFVNNTEAKMMREKFLSDLRIVIESAKKMAETTGSAGFNDLAIILGKIRELVESVSKKLTEEITISGYKGSEGGKQDEDDILEGILEGQFRSGVSGHLGGVRGRGSSTKFGEDEEDVEGGNPDLTKSLNVPGLRRLQIDLDNLKYALEFFMRGAQIKHNLRVALAEMDNYTENYSEIRGEFIGDWINDMSDSTKPRGITPLDSGEVLRDLSVKCFEARKKLLSIAESIDEYIVKFQRKMMNDPELIRSLLQNLSRSEILVEWYDQKIGDELISLIESFQETSLLFSPRKNTTGGDAYLREILTDATAANRYRVADPFFGSVWKDGDNKDLVQPILDKLSTVIGDFVVLKNIISLFVTIGQDEAISSYMSIKDIYNGLIEYMKYSSIGTLYKSAGFTNMAADRGAPTPRIPGNTPTPEFPINNNEHLYPNLKGAKTMSSDPPIAAITERFFMRSVLMSTSDVDMDSITTAQDEDKGKFFDILFIDIIKAIVAKVFVSLNIYNSINKPTTLDAFYYRAHSRMVVGGNPDIPEITTETVKMSRVLWLIEYYKSKFYSFPATITATTHPFLVAIIPYPEIPSIFISLIRYIFIKVKDSGIYTSQDVEEIIRELNKIYIAYSKETDVYQKVVDGLIDFVNQIVGVYKFDDFVEAKGLLEKGYESVSSSSVDIGLKYVDDNDISSGLGPSNRYVKTTLEERKKPSFFKDITQIKKICNDYYDTLSTDIDAYIDGVSKKTEAEFITNIMDRSLYQSIRDSEGELEKATSPTEKLEVFHRLIKTYMPTTDSVEISNFIAFHEIFMTGANTLWAILNDATLFWTMIRDMSALIDELPPDNALRYRIPLFNIAVDPLDVLNTDAQYTEANVYDNLKWRWRNDRRHRFFDVGRNGITGNTDQVSVVSTKYILHMADFDPATQNVNNNAVGRAAKRYVIDQDLMLLDLVSCITEFTSTHKDIITFDIVGGDELSQDFEVFLTYNLLHEYCEKLLASLKEVLEKFKTRLGRIANDFYGDEQKDPKILNIYNIERLIKSVFKNEGANDGLNNVAKNIKNVMKFMRKEWKRGDDRLDDLTRFWDDDAFPNNITTGISNLPTSFTYNGGNPGVNQNTKNYINKFSMYYQQFDVPFACMIYHNPMKPTSDFYQSYSGVAGVFGALSDRQYLGRDRVNSVIYSNPDTKTFSAGKSIDSDYQVLPFYTVKCDPMENSRSLLQIFNKLMKIYLWTVIDDVSKKAFTPSMREVFKYFGNTELAVPDGYNGTLREELNNRIFPNHGIICRQQIERPAAQQVILYGVDYHPRNRVVENESIFPLIHWHIMYIISEIMNRKQRRTEVMQFTEDDITKFASSYKNLLRKNLPSLREQYYNLIHRARIIQKFAEKLNVAQSTTFGNLSQHKTRDENLRYYKGYVSAIINGSETMISVITKLLEELDDNSEYFDLKTSELIVPQSSALGIFLSEEASKRLPDEKGNNKAYERIALDLANRLPIVPNFSTMSSEAKIIYDLRVVNNNITDKQVSKACSILQKLSKSSISYNEMSLDFIINLIKQVFTGTRRIAEAYEKSLLSLGVYSGKTYGGDFGKYYGANAAGVDATMTLVSDSYFSYKVITDTGGGGNAGWITAATGKIETANVGGGNGAQYNTVVIVPYGIPYGDVGGANHTGGVYGNNNIFYGGAAATTEQAATVAFCKLSTNSIEYYISNEELIPSGYINTAPITHYMFEIPASPPARAANSWDVNKPSYKESIFPSNKLDNYIRPIAKSFTERIQQIYDLAYNKGSYKLDLANFVSNDKFKELPGESNIYIKNIIELNVVPIRLAALMKELPLVNIHTYAQTFNKIIENLFKEKPKVGVFGSFDGNIDPFTNNQASAQDLLRKLLIHPLGKISKSAFYSVEKIIRGDINVESWAKPKMLSAEIWGKSLFGDIIEGVNRAVSDLSDNISSRSIRQTIKELKTRERMKYSAFIRATYDIGGTFLGSANTIIHPYYGYGRQCPYSGMPYKQYTDIINLLTDEAQANYVFNDSVFDALFLVGKMKRSRIQYAGLMEPAKERGKSSTGIINKYHPVVFGKSNLNLGFGDHGKGGAHAVDITRLPGATVYPNNYKPTGLAINGIKEFGLRNQPGTSWFGPETAAGSIQNLSDNTNSYTRPFDLLPPILYRTAPNTHPESCQSTLQAFISIYGRQVIDNANVQPFMDGPMAQYYRTFNIARNIFWALYIQSIFDTKKSFADSFTGAFTFLFMDGYEKYRYMHTQAVSDTQFVNDEHIFSPIKTQASVLDTRTEAQLVVSDTLGGANGAAGSYTINVTKSAVGAAGLIVDVAGTGIVNAAGSELGRGFIKNLMIAGPQSPQAPTFVFIPGKRALQLAITKQKQLPGHQHEYFYYKVGNAEIEKGGSDDPDGVRLFSGSNIRINGIDTIPDPALIPKIIACLDIYRPFDFNYAALGAGGAPPNPASDKFVIRLNREYGTVHEKDINSNIGETLLVYRNFPNLYTHRNIFPNLKKSYTNFLESIDNLWQWGASKRWDFTKEIIDGLNPADPPGGASFTDLRRQKEWMAIPSFYDYNGTSGVFYSIVRDNGLFQNSDLIGKPIVHAAAVGVAGGRIVGNVGAGGGPRANLDVVGYDPVRGITLPANIIHQSRVSTDPVNDNNYIITFTDKTEVNSIINYISDTSKTYPDNYSLDLSTIHYKDGNDKKSLTNIKVEELREKGRNRFNAVLIRNLFWLTNLQRVIQYKLREDLTYSPSPIATGTSIVSPHITEQRFVQ